MPRWGRSSRGGHFAVTLSTIHVTDEFQPLSFLKRSQRARKLRLQKCMGLCTRPVYMATHRPLAKGTWGQCAVINFYIFYLIFILISQKIMREYAATEWDFCLLRVFGIATEKERVRQV